MWNISENECQKQNNKTIQLTKSTEEKLYPRDVDDEWLKVKNYVIIIIFTFGYLFKY